MPNRINPLLARFDQQPALVAPEMQGIFETSLHQAATMLVRVEADPTPAKMAGNDSFWFSSDDYRSNFRPYIVRDGILLIPVKGVLLHNFPWQFGSWATGYDYIAQALKRGLADPEVKGIALVFDTPGGMVAGCFECVDRIYEARGTKPIRGYASESAYSAGYALISACDEITVTRTGGVGSIGVVTMHIDVSKAMDENGVKITFIYAGKHKVDGNPFEALSDETKARIQGRIDDLYSIFVSSVARNRGLEEKVVRETEALTFTATQAKANGLADNIGAFDDSLAAFAVELRDSEEDDEMADYTQAQYDEGMTAAREEGLSAGRKEGAVAERERITAIVNSDEGKKRPVAAQAAAYDTAMDSKQAAAFLAKLPEEKPAGKTGDPKGAAPKSQFETAMDKGKNPDLGDAADDEQAAAPSRAQATLARRPVKKA